MSDFQRLLVLFGTVFVVSALLAVGLAIADAYSHIPLADFLVKKLADIMFVSISACAGVFAGMKIESQKHQQPRLTKSK